MQKPNIAAQQAKARDATLKNIKKILAIASGKGGVGKSTVAVNLALALQKQGAQVGLLDADIYGPSQAAMLASREEKPVVQDGKLHPIVRYGLQTMSIAYLVQAEAALAWRGPMIGKALEQMLFDTAWQDLDYLIIDLPPGTGDIQLTLSQKVPVSAAIMVTTPQEISLLDVRRACEMFKKLNVPILGIVENMSTYACTHCGHEQTIFGEGGAQKLAEEYAVPVLASLPLALAIREQSDAGAPVVLQDGSNAHVEKFHQLAQKTVEQLALSVNRFPKIVVV